MTTNGTSLPAELPRDDAADAAVAADDEVIRDRSSMRCVPPALQTLRQPAFDDHRGEQGERVERRADAARAATTTVKTWPARDSVWTSS